ncbi:MAG: hypothetical protein JWM43_3180 [Acidobacteriaceae bacterium]|nr:hypothetical protein [Acidobacteriaceae bacterium]
MDGLHIGEVMHELRTIRDATFEDVADATSSRLNELKLDPSMNAVRPMSAEEIQRLEESGRCEASHETLYLLAHVLGVSIGHVPWFVDLVYPDDDVLADPHLRALDLHAEELAIRQQYSATRFGLTQQISYSQEELAGLYKRTGFVTDAKFSKPILKRFLREPFSQARYKIFVVALKDGDLFPFLSPGSLVLVDTQEILPGQPCPDMSQIYYLCSFENGHRCGWPIMKKDTLSLQTMHRDGTWHELRDAAPLGVPCGTYWSLEPLEGHDFWMEDHRDRSTMNYIRSLRRKFPPKTIQ